MFSFREVIFAFQSFGEAHQFIRKNRLWKWILLPGVIYCIFFGAGLYYIWIFSDFFTTHLSAYFGLDHWIQHLQSGWVSFFFILLGISVRMVFLVFYFSIFKFLFLIVGSPIFAYISERTEAILENRDFPFNATVLAKDMARSIRLSLRNLMFQTLSLGATLLICFIPVLGWLTPLIALFIECYFLGFSMLDFSCERRHLTAEESTHFISHHKGLAIGNGLLFYMMHVFLIVGWIFAPSYAVIASTLSLHRQKLT